tara:strand:+ start:357 stop:647 length:291 start_codon:yes stop_codon:yes gene_type:complete
MTEEVKEVQKSGPKWSLGKTFPTYEEATNQVEVLKKSFTENNQENMQTKIRRKANGMFLVKYRKDPAFAKEAKNGSGNKKNKGNTKKGKTDTGTSV